MSQEREPARTKRSQEAPGEVREATTQKEPCGARSRLEDRPGGAKSSYKGGARRKRPGGARGIQLLLLASRSHIQRRQGRQEEPGEATQLGS